MKALLIATIVIAGLSGAAEAQVYSDGWGGAYNPYTNPYAPQSTYVPDFNQPLPDVPYVGSYIPQPPCGPFNCR
jgi:hypothetical protein